MKNSLQLKTRLFFILWFCSNFFAYAQADSAPSITAEGRQLFCVGSSINIVTNFSITDLDDLGIENFFVQISEGYQRNLDLLELTGSHPNISSSWNPNEGKLTLLPTNGTTEIEFSELTAAVRAIVFSTTATDVVEEKIFSLTVDDANYLPATDHFYEFVADEGITWAQARLLAENRTYFGREGYLATLTSREEADFAGKQAAGAGWIGGSDEETEGEWKWVTGPEAGTVFWRGQVNGTSPNFAFWNNGEPNDFRGNNTTGEDYAHITDPSIGILGAWNDLPNKGGTDLYIPRGYIVEYGKPGDSPLNIVASTSIYLPQIIATTSATICESGSVTISAEPSEGNILWYETQSGNNLLGSGNSFTTPFIAENTTYFAAITVNGCNTYTRTAVTVIVNPRPQITSTTNDLICSGAAVLSAEANQGDVYWYETPTSTTPLFIGDNYQTPNLNVTKSYFVEANNLDCISVDRTEVIAEVDNTIPIFDLLQPEFILCEDIGNVDLITINAQGNYTYIWKREGALLPENTAQINVTETGSYAVSAVSEAGCVSAEQTFLVIDSEKATITMNDVIITDDSNNNSIQIANTNLGNGTYEYALDDEFGNYSDNVIFQNLTTGIHTLYVRDQGGCGTASLVFSILAYPKFFSPNGDNSNDVWKISGFDETFYSISTVFIYNRYGSLIFKMDNNEGWNGFANGKPAPSNTYWFKVTLTDINNLSIEKTGNFSLIRK